MSLVIKKSWWLDQWFSDQILSMLPRSWQINTINFIAYIKKITGNDFEMLKVIRKSLSTSLKYPSEFKWLI